MARGQLRRIFDWLFETGRLKRGDVVLDCFSGVATTAIEGTSRGVKCVGVELEERFHLLALENMEIHRRVWEAAGDFPPRLVCGDSRNLVALLSPAMVDCLCSSPPYADVLADQRDSRGPGQTSCNNPRKAGERYTADGASSTAGYGVTEGNLGGMVPGDVSCVVSSPPYAETSVIASGVQRNEPGWHTGKDLSAGKSKEYGTTEGQLAGMFPGTVEGVIDGCVSSPPYEGSSGNPVASGSDIAAGFGQGDISKRGEGRDTAFYGETDGQIGHTTGDTFWQSAAQILRQCHILLRDGATTCWVCRDFVRKGKRVPFCDQWVQLLEKCGYRVTHRIRCWLVEETTTPDLFEGMTTKRKKKASFFRLLAEKKGAPKIDNEEVIVAEKIGSPNDVKTT
jgi:hypothetical protein